MARRLRNVVRLDYAALDEGKLPCEDVKTNDDDEADSLEHVAETKDTETEQEELLNVSTVSLEELHALLAKEEEKQREIDDKLTSQRQEVLNKLSKLKSDNRRREDELKSTPSSTSHQKSRKQQHRMSSQQSAKVDKSIKLNDLRKSESLPRKVEKYLKELELTDSSDSESSSSTEESSTSSESSDPKEKRKKKTLTKKSKKRGKKFESSSSSEESTTSSEPSDPKEKRKKKTKKSKKRGKKSGRYASPGSKVLNPQRWPHGELNTALVSKKRYEELSMEEFVAGYTSILQSYKRFSSEYKARLDHLS